MKNNKEDIPYPILILACIIVVLFFSFILQFTWNFTMPFLFNLPELKYIDAIMLYILSKVIIGG